MMQSESESKPIKNRSEIPRARALRLLKRAAKKLSEIPDEYLDQALMTLGKQLKATKPMWDVAKKKMIKIPDEKIRQDAAIMILAYKWGKPVERSVTATAKFEDLPALLERMQHAPSLQKTVEGKEIPPLITDSPSEGQQASEEKSEGL